MAIGIILPKNYTVSRSVVINAPTEKIHTYVNDLNMLNQWSPWEESDPDLIIQKGHITSGVGAHQSWSGKSGSGELTLTKSDPDIGIEYKLLFNEKKYKCESSIKYKNHTNSTEVVWNMNGYANMPVLGGYFALLMDSMVGPMFEKGLHRLKRVVEQ